MFNPNLFETLFNYHFWIDVLFNYLEFWIPLAVLVAIVVAISERRERKK